MTELLAYAIAIGVTALCVGIHYEALRALAAAPVPAPPSLPLRGRRRILAIVVALLVVHFVEIGVYAGAYHLMAGPYFGSVHGAATFSDYFYYSATVYSTLGFGDLVPAGALRALTGAESLAGLALITWSASFTFLQMQRFWDAR